MENFTITHTISFTYSGAVRVVRNAVAKPTSEGNVLWVGLEATKDGQESNRIKAYRADNVQGHVTVLDSRVGESA